MTRSTPRGRFPRTCAFACAALLLMAGCDQPAESGASAPDRMFVVSGNEQVADIGGELPEAVMVRVVDRRGRLVAGQPVEFVVLSDGGSAVAEASNTDADGRVAARWKLGLVAGEQTLQARITDGHGGVVLAVTARAHARAGLPAIITAVGRTDLGTDSLFADSLAVRVTDGWANPVPGVQVDWRTSADSVSPSFSMTDSAGIARAYWMIPPRAAAQPRDETHTLSASAVGHQVAFTATLQVLPLVLTVTSPADGAVLRTRDVRIVAECRRCRSFIIRADGQVLYSGPATALDSIFPIGTATITFEGDGHVVTRRVYVQENPAWKEIATGGSQVRDYEPGRLLFTTDSGSVVTGVWERSLDTGQERRVFTPYRFVSARLTARGALVTYTYSLGGLHAQYCLAEISTTPLTLCSFQLKVFDVTRRWLLWSAEDLGIFFSRHDFADGSDVRITSYANGGVVAENGDVVYTTPQVFRYRNGVTTALGSGSAPRTDGVNVVWWVYDSPRGYKLVLHDGSGEQVLSSSASVPVYAIENGWTVYTGDDAGGQPRLWRRAPDGTTAPIGMLSAGWPVSLGPNGAVVLSNGDRWYVVHPDGDRSDIGVASSAWTKWIGERLIAGLGNTVFEVDY